MIFNAYPNAYLMILLFRANVGGMGVLYYSSFILVYIQSAKN